jgi:hypothetical protein
LEYKQEYLIVRLCLLELRGRIVIVTIIQKTRMYNKGGLQWE